MKTGDILFCKSKSWLSKAIRFVTSGTWSHTANVIVKDGKLYIFDAQKEGCFIRTFENWIDRYNYDYDYLTPPYEVDEKRFIKSCEELTGCPYDIKHLLRFGLDIVQGQVKYNTDFDKFGKNNKYICSELSAKLHGVSQPEKQTPQSLYNLLINNNWK